MKGRISPVVAGIVVTVLFVGIIYATKLTGVWKYRSSESSKTSETQQVKPPESTKTPPPSNQTKDDKTASMTLGQYCWESRIPLACAQSYLGIDHEQSSLTIGEIAALKNMQVSSVIKIIKDCYEEEDENEEGRGESEGERDGD